MRGGGTEGVDGNGASRNGLRVDSCRLILVVGMPKQSGVGDVLIQGPLGASLVPENLA